MLSGNSPRNRDWIFEAQRQLGGLFDGTYVADYHHWQTGEPNIDLTHELGELANRQPEFGDNYGIFAKSIGTVLAVQALEQQIVKPKFLLFCGLPLGYIEQDYSRFNTVLAASQLPLVIIHNRDDKVGSATAAKSYMASKFTGESNYRFVETPGDTHDYEDYELLRGQLKTLLERA